MNGYKSYLLKVLFLISVVLLLITACASPSTNSSKTPMIIGPSSGSGTSCAWDPNCNKSATQLSSTPTLPGINPTSQQTLLGPCNENFNKIVFSSDRRNDGNSFHFDLFVANPDGSNLYSLTNDLEFDNYPAWSPDHCWVAFTSNRNDNDDELYFISMRNAEIIRITQLPGSDKWPTWSPDGKRIAFVHTGENNSYDIYMVNSDGTNLTQLTNTPETEHDPEWSPLGNRIVFECGNPTTDEKTKGHGGICLVDPDGKNYQRLTPISVHNYLYPTWSPDGQQIALVTNLTSQLEIYIMNADGTGLRQVSTWGGNQDPNDLSWSPDGTSLVYKVTTMNSTNTGGNEELQILNLSTMKLNWVTRDDNRDQSPDW
jgi:Tol biopolymer transport system component